MPNLEEKGNEFCYLIRIWRRVGIDLVKIWPIYKESLEEGVNFIDAVDKMLNLVIRRLIPELNEKLKNELILRYGEEFAEELEEMEKNFYITGNYDMDLEPVLGFQYMWWEILADITRSLPPAIERLIVRNKTFREKGVYGSFLRKGLVSVVHDRYPIKLVFGLQIVKRKGPECEF